MGAKTAVKLRNRGAAYKCDLCGRKLMTPDALVVHQRTAHNIITRRTKPKQVVKPVKTTKVETKAKTEKKPLPTLKNPPKISDKKEKVVVKNESSKVQSEKMKKTVEFECPKCFRLFQTYFPAHKHIQKYHCVNRHGAKVPPNSPNLIQPVRIELCLKCNRKVKSIQTHVCDNKVKDKNDSLVFMCMACEEWFPNLKSFDTHVLSLHGGEVESMFFPTSAEFTKWKMEMESQTNVSYAILDNYDSKRYYHCNFVKENHEDRNTTYFCPSTIVIQEFSKGIQVHYYKQHYKHSFVEYNLSDKYKKYSITSFLKRSEEYNNLPTQESGDNDMYLQFKTLMEGIVVDAAKINISTLQVLIGKALDMTSILTNYDEEADDSSGEIHNSSQNMNDSQISKVLENSNLNMGKRKNNDKLDTSIDTKRIKFNLVKQEETNLVTSSPKIINSFSLANNVDSKNKFVKDENKNDKNKSNNVTPLQQSNESDQSPSSFNDSYKDFVVKNFPFKEVKSNSKAKKPVKTKIGQFKPNISPKSSNEPKKIESEPKKIEPEPKKAESEPKKVESEPKKVESEPKKVESEPKKVGFEPKKVVSEPKKVESEPKKVGFEPKKVVSEPKKIDSRKSNRISLDKPKVDFEYEVKEQKGGYNILILKI
ncbi:unnamed protein product [Euphydryas editha]|uniref:C2H2-type domain-containing protein n=1 Tax=Euphydryas editha TaxID=104508 RepID=A0AAU9T9P1_EUPED|nr:unnamed protein product [Euphydryas editha]